MESSTTDNEPTRTHWDEGQIWVKSCHAATRKLLALVLSRKNQEKLHITTTELNLISGDGNDYGPCFVHPFSYDKMREYAVREQPWDKFDIHGLNIDDTPELCRYRGWVNACQVIKGLHYSLDNFFGDIPPRDMSDEDNELDSVYAPQWQWNITSWANAKDTSQPHITAFMVDSQPFRANRFNSGEISIAYGLIAKRRIEDGYNDHRYIPIIIISASGFQARILQIWHDKQNPEALQVRSSPIMDFNGGVQNNLDDWVTLLCWIAGDPVGDTKNGTEVVRVVERDA
ncbi:uncharacterized protein N7479_009755 [Penicillium vulpinum]|uniref:Uncharacterized protein n=1 Tax=Penicillium vulpinum TaxID=29845 RepID=A0A1V6RYA6_9EURO|nr:uncharacterized protein N7479_009755 [Penicillium vulpinum]KAJ5951342.1 hypothetical protein N7479_009755 [Penicillium vulpinum]OQE06578.1 hypothetical protein PENVUL_c017G00123 [Penicillium vulpinum]